MASAVLVLASCEAAGTLVGGGWRSDYLVARQALENGNYDLAARRYGRLMQGHNSSSASQLQLEYAHALLRAGRNAEAVEAANPLVDGPDNAIRASALAVRGTAMHEAARDRLARGLADDTAQRLLVAAQADLTIFLTHHSALDTAGSMHARSQIISAQLARLG